MSMDGLNHMVDDPFSGQRLAWQGELEKSIEQIAKLTAENAELRASEEAMSVAMGLLRDERDELRSKLDIKHCDEKEYIESLCADLCKMEDALGFKNDCSDKDGAFIPTIGPWLERLRDLISAEGELGDVKTKLKQAEAKVQRDEMWDLLKKLEWIDYQLDGGNCTACNGRWPYHKPECIYVRKREEK